MIMKNKTIKKKVILFILLLMTSISFGQEKMKYDTEVQKTCIKKINSDLKIKDGLIKAFGKENKEAFVNSLATYSALSKKNQENMEQIIISGMVARNQISTSEASDITTLLSDEKLDKSFLMDIKGKNFSTVTGKVLIPKLVEIRLENSNGGVQAQGSKGKLIGAILGGIAGWFAGGGTPAGVGPGVAIGSVAGDIIEEEWNKYSSGGASITPSKKGCFEEYPFNRMGQQQ